MAGDPINASTGSKYLQDDDYSDGNWLTFRRFYNSMASVASTAMGVDWRHSFDRSLQLSNTGSRPGAILPPNAAVMFRPDGKQETFKKANGLWTTDPDIPDTLIETDNAQGVATSYTVFVAALRHFETYDATGMLQAVTDGSGQGITLTYSTTLTAPAIAPWPGLLLTVTDPKGRQLNFIYNSNGNVSQVMQPDGGMLTYTYDASGNLLSVQYPDTKTRQYVYNESSLTGGVNLPNAMTGIVDEAGVRYENTTYDSTGRATSSSFAGSVGTTHITYNSNGTSTVQYPLGHSATMGFITVNGLIRVGTLDQPCGPQCDQPWKTRTYDANGYPSAYTDFNGNVTTSTYDVNGLLDQQVEASGGTNQRTTNTTWDTTLRVPLQSTIVDASGTTVAKTAWVYNTAGQPLARCEIDPAQANSYTCATTGTPPVGVRRWTYSYCTAIDTTQCPIMGLLLAVDGPRTEVADVTTYAYYLTDSTTAHHGDLQSVTDALGHTTTYLTYDGAGRVTSLQDANGVVTDLTYTPRGWLASRSVAGATTTLTYTSYGAVASLTDPDNVTTTFTYDAAHRLTDITDAQGNSIHYTLDAAGNKTGEETRTSTGTVTRSLSRSYNALGQLTAVMDGLNHTVFNASYGDSYDGNGNLVHSADALGVQRQQGFDALNRLVSTIDNYNGTDTATQDTTSTLAYDALDRLEGVSDPDGLGTLYGYDGLGNRTSVLSPDTGTSTDTYDAAGNRLVHTDAKGIVSTSTYDVLDRLTGVSYADSTLDVGYHYDEADTVTGCSSSYPLGRLTRVIESAVTTVYCYDARGNVTRKSQVQGTTTDTTSYAYTLANRLSGISTPSQATVSYTRDSNGRISGVQVTPAGASTAPPAVVSNVAYLPFGPVSSYTLGNGQTITRTYDANYALTDLVSPALELHVARDAAGNITALGNAPGANPATETYAYDPLYRLTGVSDAGAALESYTYNKTGDRLNKTAAGLATGAYLYTSGTHQLASTGNAPRVNDANGNTTGSVVGGETFGFGYNGRNRLTVAQRNGQTVGTYTYNALGQRIGKVATFPQAVTERYAYDEVSQLIGEYGTTNRDYVWLGDIPVAVIDNTTNGSVTTSTVNYVIADQLGTPRAVSDGTGTVIWQWVYQGNSLGEQQPTSATGYALDLRYPGQYYDAESGTNYNYFRTYEPATGRYLQSDPIGLAGGISTYVYVGNNPLSNVDPLGLQELLFRIGRIGGLLSEEPLVPRPLIEPVKPLPPGAPTPQLPEDFPKIPTDPTQCPGKGWEWRGAPGSKPGDPNGGWYNPEKHWTLHPDMDHPEPIPPHWDWVDENKVKYRIFPQAPPIDPLHPPIT
jgi:RHS repeat-associated protein